MGTTEFKSKVVEVTFQSAAVATGNGTALRLDGASAILAQVAGITTATITWEATLNGTTWVAIQATSLNSATTATTATADGLYLLNCSGAAQVRARISAYTSGTITVTGRSTSMPFALASAGGGGGSGTVTSVAQTVPAEFAIAGSPVTTSGTLAITKATQTANKVWASATSGGAAQPAFRALVAADLPSPLLQYWEESQTTVDTHPVDAWTPQSAGSITVNDPWVPVTDVVPDIESNAVSYYVGTFLAGRYRVNYIEGALQYNGESWGLNAGAPYGFRVIHSGGSATIEGPYTTYGLEATQADVEAANAGAYVEFDHAGGSIGVYLQDAPYADNLPGTPNPTFELIGLPTTINLPVSAVIQARGQGGMVLSDGISAVPDPVLGKMIQRWASGYTFNGGRAVFEDRVAGANPEADQDFVTVAYLASRYFQFTAWAASYGTYGSVEFAKWTPGSEVGTNADAVIQPKGTGALLAQQPDGTTTGGDARGTYSVDFQRLRSSSSQVAAGAACAVICGSANTAEGSASSSIVGGGATNTVSGSAQGILCGSGNSIEDGATSAAILTGSGNGITGTAFQAAILSGSSNACSAANGVVLGGTSSIVSAQAGLAWGTEAEANHAGALVFSSEGSGGAASAAADECTLKFIGGFRFLSGSAAFNVGDDNTATGELGMAFGRQCEASGFLSFALGYGNVSNADYSMAFGNNAQATGNHALAFVQGHATGAYAWAKGDGATASHAGSVCWNDTQENTLASSVEDEFSLWFSGGYRFKGGNAVFDGTVGVGNLTVPTGSAPGDQTLLALPLNVYGGDAHLLGEPDGWLLINGKNVPYYD